MQKGKMNGKVATHALAVIPFRHKPRNPDFVQRRIRRPSSVSEVEALVQAVEKLGTGRWRDVKQCAFDNAKHITYVHLKKITEIRVQGAQEIQNKCRSKCCPKNCKSSYKLGKDVAKMLHEVDGLNTKGEKFGKDYQITHKLPRKPIGQIPLDEIVGQEPFKQFLRTDAEQGRSM